MGSERITPQDPCEWSTTRYGQELWCGKEADHDGDHQELSPNEWLGRLERDMTQLGVELYRIAWRTHPEVAEEQLATASESVRDLILEVRAEMMVDGEEF